jgi:hypothetical protein
MAGSLDSHRQPALVLGAGPGLTARLDSPILIDIAAQRFVVFIVNRALIYAEATETLSTNATAASGSSSILTRLVSGISIPHYNLHAAPGKTDCAPQSRFRQAA